MTNKEGTSRSEGIPASLQLKLRPETVPWVYAALLNQPQVELYNNELPEPFTRLVYVVAQNQGQLVFAANLFLGDAFRKRYGSTIGSIEDLALLLQRYPEHEFSDDKQRLVLGRRGQVQGIIARVAEDRVIIQRGGQVGQLSLSPETPVNSLSIYLDQFSLLIQRYISAIWKASPETDQKQMQLVLSLPTLLEGAPQTYFSTFEIIGKGFRERPRPVDLDKDIGGYLAMKAIIKGLFMDFIDPDVSRRFGTQPFSNRFILVTGPEGTGKSLFPKALDRMLRSKLGDKFEHFRLHLGDMLLQYGPHTATIVETIFDHIRENEKKGIPTLLHLDNLDGLVPLHQRVKDMRLLGVSPGTLVYNLAPPSEAEFAYYLQTINPIVLALRDFGRDIGGASRHVIIYGESRLPYEELPDALCKTFRRVFSLSPTVEDLADILRVQIGTTRGFAEKTGNDPFISGIESGLIDIAQHANGLNGRDIQQALLNIATRRKAEWDGETYAPITAEEITKELQAIKLSKGIGETTKRPLGFPLPHKGG